MVQRWPRDVERFQPDLVLLLYGGFINGWLVDGQPLDACDPAYRAHYGALLDHAIDTLSAGGARVVVALPAYNRVYGIVAAADATVDCLTATYTDAVARHADRATILRLDLFACPTGTPATRHRSTGEGCASTASTTGTRRPAWPASGSSTSWSSPRGDLGSGGSSGAPSRPATPGRAGPSG